MLKKLVIKNFALIENIELDFKNGFTVITGETGSGKSILLGALQLLLGERADSKMILNLDQKTIVEGEFEVSHLGLVDFFNEYDLDYQPITLIRREVRIQGNSRAFVNDTPVSLQVIKELTARLVHIHSQHHTLKLKDSKFQLDLLDVYADTYELRVKVSELFNNWKKQESELETLKAEIAKAKREFDFNVFLVQELETLKLEDNDFKQIEETVNRADQLEEINHSFGRIVNELEAEGGIIEKLDVLARLKSYGDNQLSDLYERIQQVNIELKDILNSALDGMDTEIFSEVEMINQKALLDHYNSLLRKHNINNQEELLILYQQLNESIISIKKHDDNLGELNEELKNTKEAFNSLALELRAKRSLQLIGLQSEIESKLGSLKLNEAKLEIHLNECHATQLGIDSIHIEFSANKGIPLKSIDKIASGGELSRLMLVIHSILSQRKGLSTLIFDEIDTGVSGEVAHKMGELLAEIGQDLQLIAITHLPQVASKGTEHLKVEKIVTSNSTRTQIIELNSESRLQEVARLMSGSAINDAAIEAAKNLMN